MRAKSGAHECGSQSSGHAHEPRASRSGSFHQRRITVPTSLGRAATAPASLGPRRRAGRCPPCASRGRSAGRCDRMRQQLSGAIPLALVVLIAITTLAPSATGAADPTGRRSLIVGRSVDGRPITAVESGDFDSPARGLVVGGIPGNEPAGIAVAAQLMAAPPVPELDLWIVPDLNPDGVAAGTRGNAHGVDLNRNFPWRWRPLSGLFFSGRRPLS